ncbi:phage minor tail protein L [Chitiniphilus shinanonensis]|uniref:phage minor tail protein L n=1 Tax=Chitiniphilus shinanonensis TaxID=553088 RepID=UPI00306C004B
MLKTLIQTLDPGARIELFELDMTPIGGELVRFHAGTNALDQALVWQGEQYAPYPVQADGFAASGSGALPRPKLRVANALGLMSALAATYDDLLGCRLVRRVTLARYLDAVNFPAGNPEADPSQEFPPESWIVDRKSVETDDVVEFELASPLDVAGQKLPARQIVRNCCAWLAIGGYRGPYCGYTGGPVADRNDQPTANLPDDRCGGRLASCKLRFGEHQPLPYGGFPAAGLLRM